MPSRKAILGISAYYHDSAACLVVDGEIIAAAEEERFTRVKHDASFPTESIRFLIEKHLSGDTTIDAIAFYEKPLLKFERLLETYHAFSPRGLKSFLTAMPLWIHDKLFMKSDIRKRLQEFGLQGVPIFFPEHHVSHAASAFFPSAFNEAAIITLDGVGEWATTTIGKGTNNGVEILRELRFPHSLGLLYSSFTYYCGFKVNSGEYKLMGLSPFGDLTDPHTVAFINTICSELVDIREDGSFLLNMKHFHFATGLTMTNDKSWEKMFGLPRRDPSDQITVPYMNLARAIQRVTEIIILKITDTARLITGCANAVLAGGVALNCVANAAILASGAFDKLWIQPASGDSGGAIGAALAVYHIQQDNPRMIISEDKMKGMFLGPEFHGGEIEAMLKKENAVFQSFQDIDEVSGTVAQLLSEGQVGGWFQGRMEFGPRALGNRSIIADPRSDEMQRKINLKVKFREGFRPFAPSILEEDIALYFKASYPSPYMLFVMTFLDEHTFSLPSNFFEFDLDAKLQFQKSKFPAVTHVDYTARVQSVNRESNAEFWNLLKKFKTITGCAMLVNTSFNVRGEPIVCTPLEAFECFMRTDLDFLAIGNFLLHKKAQQVSKTHFEKAFDTD